MSTKKRETFEKRSSRRKRSKRPSLIQRLPLTLVIAGVAAIVIALITAGSVTAYSIHLENNDAFCASCHTQPESAYYQQSQDASKPTLAAFHAAEKVRCIDCHSGGGTFGRVDGLKQGFQDLIAYYSNHYQSPAVTTSKLSDSSCLKCHSDRIAQASFNEHFHAFLSQWQAVDTQAAHCVDCHTSHNQTAKDQEYLTESTVRAVCSDCHNRFRGE